MNKVKHKLKIADKQEPGEGRKRIQELIIGKNLVKNLPVLDNVIPVKEYENCEECRKAFKNWFNTQFSKPQPIKCDECNGLGDIYTGYDKEGIGVVYCPECGGDGIQYYVSYVYDEDTIDSMLHYFNYVFENEDGTFYYEHKGKELKIIVNPYIKVTADKEQ